jgi:transcriptional regulator with XRE-family HTH domain
MTTDERLQISRNRKGITQSQLAELIGTDNNTVSRWERDILGIKTENLKKIAVALNISLSYLLGEKEEPERYPGLVKFLEESLKASPPTPENSRQRSCSTASTTTSFAKPTNFFVIRNNSGTC